MLEPSKKIPKCMTCGLEFPTFHELALHIVAQKKRTHPKGRKWASKVLAEVKKRQYKPRLPKPESTAFGDTQREKAIRKLSGVSQRVRTVCPSCRSVDEQELPVEYIQDDEAWRNSSGTLITSCANCRKTS